MYPNTPFIEVKNREEKVLTYVESCYGSYQLAQTFHRLVSPLPLVSGAISLVEDASLETK
jgi:hypothetical protein